MAHKRSKGLASPESDSPPSDSPTSETKNPPGHQSWAKGAKLCFLQSFELMYRESPSKMHHSATRGFIEKWGYHLDPAEDGDLQPPPKLEDIPEAEREREHIHRKRFYKKLLVKIKNWAFKHKTVMEKEIAMPIYVAYQKEYYPQYKEEFDGDFKTKELDGNVRLAQQCSWFRDEFESLPEEFKQDFKQKYAEQQ
ncbi:hypothetical protein V5O48_014153 [Marasmius crinis-equi]|uniref:Uncharacterized protein n=1 Tax=Marasmius crinis-equi TaxID=585013 RepID=A0ABR3EY39_9AGAR